MIDRKIRITDQTRLDNALSAVRLVPIDGTKEVTISDFKRSRSLSQNNLLHMWRMDISGVTGETIAEVRTRLSKTHMLPILLASESPKDRSIQLVVLNLRKAYKQGFQEESEYVFTQYLDRLSSKDLNVSQFAEYLTAIELECSQQQITIRRPDDYGFAIEGSR